MNLISLLIFAVTVFIASVISVRVFKPEFFQIFKEENGQWSARRVAAYIFAFFSFLSAGYGVIGIFKILSKIEAATLSMWFAIALSLLLAPALIFAIIALGMAYLHSKDDWLQAISAVKGNK